MPILCLFYFLLKFSRKVIIICLKIFLCPVVLFCRSRPTSVWIRYIHVFSVVIDCAKLESSSWYHRLHNYFVCTYTCIKIMLVILFVLHPYAHVLKFWIKRWTFEHFVFRQRYISTPYTAGNRCGSCPNHCNNGLCGEYTFFLIWVTY